MPKDFALLNYRDRRGANIAGEKTVSSLNGSGKTGQLHIKKKKKFEHSLVPYTKINSKWIEDLNVRLDTIKLLQENLSKTFFDINGSSSFFHPSSTVMEIKTKINKWDLIKLKSFCTTKEIINNMKNNPDNGRKYLQHTQQINLPNLQTAQKAQYPKTKPPNQKMDKRPK